METAMDQDLQAAQDRLLKKRVALKVMDNPTRSMLNIDICEHGFPKSVTCPKCNPPEIDENAARCEHGNIISEGYYCSICLNAQRQARMEKEIEEKKNRLLDLIKNPEIELRGFMIPAKYISSSFETFTGNEKLVSECMAYSEGGLVLYGNTGCGKTHLAVSIMRNMYKSNINEIINSLSDQLPDYSKIKKQIFKPVPDLLLEIRSAFKDGASESEDDIIKKYSRVPLLVLDDLGSEKTSEYSITTLYIIIDRRDRELMPTIITTNLNPKEIEEKLGARIASRLSGMKNIKINMPDYRKKRS